MEVPTDHVIVSEMPADMTEDRLKEIFGAYGTVKWCKLSAGKGGKAGIFTSAILELGSVDEAQYFVTALDENIPEGLEKPIRVRYKPPSKGKSKGGFGGGYSPSPRPVLAEARPAPYQPFSAGGGKGPVFASKGMALESADFGELPASIDAVVKMLVASGRLPGGKWANDENTVHISGLPQDTSSNDLLRIFSPFGAIAAGGAYAQLNPDGTSKGTGIINFLDSEGAQTAISALNGCTLPNGMSLRLRAFTAQKPGKGA